MTSPEEGRHPWRIRRPGSTGLLVIVFIGALLLWLQVRPPDTAVPAPTSPPPVVTTSTSSATSATTGSLTEPISAPTRS